MNTTIGYNIDSQIRTPQNFQKLCRSSCVEVRLPDLKCGAREQSIFEKENWIDLSLRSLLLGFNLYQGPADSEYIMCLFWPF